MYLVEKVYKSASQLSMYAYFLFNVYGQYGINKHKTGIGLYK